MNQASQIDEETQQKFHELQVLENNIQNLLIQKQTSSMEFGEASNALDEVRKSKNTIYKMIGSIMVVVDKESTIKELEEKKKILELRAESVSKQEKTFETKAHNLQQEIKKLLETKSPTENKK